MVTLQNLSIASTLLRSTADKGTVDESQPTSPSIPAIVADARRSGDSARNSVSSAIFNAVANVTERRDAFIDDVLRYIDHTFMQDEARTRETDPELAERQSFKDAQANKRAAGERLRQQVLDDPDTAKDLMRTISRERPGLSSDDAMAFLMVDLGKIYEASQDKSSRSRS